MYTKHDRQTARARRHRRVRRHVSGTAARPRLCVHRSLRHISAQVIDDTLGTTLVAASTVESEVAGKITGSRSSSAAAQVVGEVVATRALALGVSKVVFDRGGYLYHGRIAALAQAARQAGLEL
jgi:large subunit ribosomal protein L18